MDILKVAQEWAKDEVFSSKFFILFGILFLIGALGFWQLGKSAVAKAFIYPTLVCGTLLLIVGIGLLITNLSRMRNFESAYNANSLSFVESEITRAEKSIGEYNLVVFKIIPAIIVILAVSLIFIKSPIWKVISITTMAMLIVILIIDTNASERIKQYKHVLTESKTQFQQP